MGRYYGRGGQRFAEVYVTRAGGGDVLASPESLRAALDLHAAIMELEVGGKTYESGLCFENSYGACLKFGTLKLFNFDRNAFEAQAGDLQAAFKAETYADGQPVNPYEIFGGMERTEDGDIRARSLSVGYLLSQDGISVADWNAWVTKFTALLSSPQWKAPHAQVQVSYWTSLSVDRELERLVMVDQHIVMLAFVVMIAVGTGLFLKFQGSQVDFVKSRVLLANLGVLSVALSIGMGYGLATWFGLTFTSLQMILPFILLGIGIDGEWAGGLPRRHAAA